jgi:hypothetical protein
MRVVALLGTKALSFLRQIELMSNITFTFALELVGGTVVDESLGTSQLHTNGNQIVDLDFM